MKRPVILHSDKCNGCVNCMKRCPTEAIRVRGGKAAIMYERCVGCGECVRVCPTNAKVETPDALSDIFAYGYKIAVPSVALYGQFANLYDCGYVRDGLLALGFDYVADAASVAGSYAAAVSDEVKSKDNLPIIGTVCPVVTKLIQLRYEHLLPHMAQINQPERIAAKAAIKRALDKGIKREDIGVFVISPCAANILEFDECADVNGVISIKSLYVKLLAKMNAIKSPCKVDNICADDIISACNIAPPRGIAPQKTIMADGIQNVFGVLDELERDKLIGIDYLQLFACSGGCLGGSLNMENAFLARTRLVGLSAALPQTTEFCVDRALVMRREPYGAHNIFKLDDDRAAAMKKVMEIKRIYESLPHMDCGACGAPCCMAFAEDIVRGEKVECKYKHDGGGT